MKKKASKKIAEEPEEIDSKSAYDYLKNFIEDNKEVLGDDYKKLHNLLDKTKEKIENNKELQKIVKFIKEHPIISVAAAVLIGASIYGVLKGGKKDGNI